MVMSDVDGERKERGKERCLSVRRRLALRPAHKARAILALAAFTAHLHTHTHTHPEANTFVAA